MKQKTSGLTFGALTLIAILIIGGGRPARAGFQGDFISVTQEVIPVGHPVPVQWSNTPGNAQDWITVVPVGTPEDKWGTWTYLKGSTSGVFEVNGLTPGDYEARLYYDWPKGGFKVIERIRFTIGPSIIASLNNEFPSVKSDYLALASDVFAQGVEISVNWRNTPGNAQDWITVVTTGTPEDQYGKWAYLKGQSSGAFQVTGLGPGDYEVRLYFDWPKGGFKVIDRVSFKVR